MSSKNIKIQIINDHQEYKKGQIIDLDEKTATSLLTNGKALRIHRKTNVNEPVKTEENSEAKIQEKESKKSKKNDQ